MNVLWHAHALKQTLQHPSTQSQSKTWLWCF